MLRQAKVEYDATPNVAICDFGEREIVTTDKIQMGIDMRAFRSRSHGRASANPNGKQCCAPRYGFPRTRNLTCLLEVCQIM
jgi:hypothetical protein